MKKEALKILKQVVGIDISKDSFYACFKVLYEDGRVVIKGTKSFDNTISGMKKFYEWVNKRNKTQDAELIFVMEATGVYYEELAYFLHEKEEIVSVQLAQRLKYFAKGNNIKTKNDKVDSKMIAEFGIEKKLKGRDFWTPPSKEFKMIRDLAREHTNLKQAQSATKSQLHALKYSHDANTEVIKMKEEQISFYEKHIDTSEKEMRKLVKSDSKLYEKINKIETIKGVRFITIIKVITEVNGFLLFNNIRQLVSYAGLDIIENQSGKITGKTKISKKGNARIRAALYMPALSAKKYNQPLKIFYNRVMEDRTIKQQGVVAVMRKLLILIYTLWKNDSEFDPDYEQNKTKLQKTKAVYCNS